MVSELNSCHGFESLGHCHERGIVRVQNASCDDSQYELGHNIKCRKRRSEISPIPISFRRCDNIWSDKK